MTSVKTMQRPLWRLTLCVIVGLALGGCSNGQKLVQPDEIVSPFDGDRLIAVVPFANESGVSAVDQLRAADLLTYELEQVHGFRTVPVNRVATAMESMRMNSVQSAGEAAALMSLLHVDGLVVGTITAYDPYKPMRLGMGMQLFSREPAESASMLDPHDLVRSASDHGVPPDRAIRTAIASGLFDASNHGVRRDLQAYAKGRATPDSAFGERAYDVSMELYTRFVCHRLIRDLLMTEQNRLATAEMSTNAR